MRGPVQEGLGVEAEEEDEGGFWAAVGDLGAEVEVVRGMVVQSQNIYVNVVGRERYMLRGTRLTRGVPKERTNAQRLFFSLKEEQRFEFRSRNRTANTYTYR